jgi:hypothetical protein
MALEKIVFDSSRQLFVMNHTGMVTLEAAKLQYAITRSEDSTNPGARGLKSGQFLSADTVKDIRVCILPGADIDLTLWGVAIDQAIYEWKNKEWSINMTWVSDPTTANIFITSFNTPVAPTSPSYMKEVVQGAFPLFNGTLGRTISINRAYDAISASAKKQAVFHALSHCLWFTNNDDGTGLRLLQELPAPNDPNSVFETLSHDWVAITFYDYLEIIRAYPKPGRFSNTIPLLRYYSAGYKDHSTLTDVTVYAGGTANYVFEKIDGYVKNNNTDIPNLIPVYRYEHPLAHDNFLTQKTSDFPNLDRLGFKARGIIGYVTSIQLTGQRPLYRYYNSADQDHFYTTVFDEVGPSKGYVAEDIVGYVW